MNLSLHPITPHNFEDCIKLSVTTQQDEFVADNIRSLANAYRWYPDTYPLGMLDLMFLLVERK